MNNKHNVHMYNLVVVLGVVVQILLLASIISKLSFLGASKI